MSLKTFHLVFITTATLLALGCGLEWLREFFTDRTYVLGLILGVLAFASAGALVCYERYMVKKFKTLSHEN